ncbi:hypothetical protein LUZ60_010268 [Juncus effusus]|nr:hypothetical protein LUZ60_010268 [Juncus effusus]
MDEKLKMEKHSSAAAFVEGGIQDACDDSCSICLEEFCESDPSTVTGCKHEFHLQCILEWCQRSSQCPMCWQPISMKDPTSQELLEAVEQERDLRVNRARTTTIFRHPMLGDFELQHLPVGADDAELEERIIQHLAAAAAMGRTHRIARREGARGRSSSGARPHFLVFSSPDGGSVQSGSTGEDQHDGMVSPVVGATGEESPTSGQSSALSAGSGNGASVQNNGTTAGQTTPVSNDRAGPSDLNSFSESLKSRLQSVSTRYKESITKSTRGWRDRFFSRNSAIADISSDVRNEVNAGIAAVSRMMERLETRDGQSQTSPEQPTDNTNAGSTESQTGQSESTHEVGVERVVVPTGTAGTAAGTDGAGSSRSFAELK